MHLVAIGGSDAGISAALRARELDPTTEVTVVVADAYPNFSICGIPYYVSGEVTHWRNLAHRTLADLEATGMQLRLDTVARTIDVVRPHSCRRRPRPGSRSRSPTTHSSSAPGRCRSGPRSRGSTDPTPLVPADGVHLLHSMGDTFAVMRTLEEAARPARSSSAPAMSASRWPRPSRPGVCRSPRSNSLPEVLPTVDPELGALVHRQLAEHGVDVH